jgi:hypothetical protein
MPGPIYAYLADDHDRLDALLARVVGEPGEAGAAAYTEFRNGLLRHIAMEEKILLREITRLQGGRPLPIAERIHLDHGAITSLLVPPPTRAIINTLRSILQVHNALEEQEGGMYQVCEQIARDEQASLMEQLKNAPPVPMLPHNPRPETLEATKRALARAGYSMKE